MIDCNIDGHTALITLNNPPANTFTAESLAQLEALVGDLNRNLEVYAAVISGQGEKFFSAGADVKSFADGDKVRARLMAQRFGAAFEALQEARPVVIAADQRLCHGRRARVRAGLRSAHRRGACADGAARGRQSGCCRADAARRLCRGWSARAGRSA